MITLGLDVGGTKILGVAIDDARPAEVLADERVPTPTGGVGLVDALVEVATVLSDRLAPQRQVAAIGVGVPGLVDSAGVLRMGPHLEQVSELPLQTMLAERTSLPVLVDNDANCHALAEQRAGAAVGSSEALVVTLGTGIGAGIITGGVLLEGANGFAGEPGHMVVDAAGPVCACGKRGCWEVFASGTGLARLARDAAVAGRLEAVLATAGGDPDAVRGEHVTAAARRGDAEALAVLDRLAWWIALGLANLVNVLDPAKVVIGGGLVEVADLLLGPVRTHFAGLVMAGEQRPPLPIVAAQLGEQAGAMGAAHLVHRLD